MKNCVGIAELLCAYADNEISESNRRLVEDHLVICENCSAILKLYEEISSSISDTNVPAPDALCIGVMNRIQSEEPPKKVAMSKKRRQYHYILTRYAPVAACLVVMLLVLQFWNPLQAMFPASQSDYAMSPAPESALFSATMDDMDDAGEYFQEADSNVAIEAGGGLDAQATPEPEGTNDQSQRRAGGESLDVINASIEISEESSVLLTINRDSLTPTGATFVITNEKDETIEFGDQYFLQTFIDDTWQNVEITNNESGFNAVLHIYEPGETHTFEADWSFMYGHLPEGTFRLVKAIEYANSDNPAFYIADEFIIR